MPGIKLQPLPWKSPGMPSQDREGWVVLTGKGVTQGRSMELASSAAFHHPSSILQGKPHCLRGKSVIWLFVTRGEKRKIGF